MSNQQPERNQVSTPSELVKSQKRAQAGVTRPRSLDVDSEIEAKAIPVKAIYFGQVVKWPQLAGAGSVLMAGKPLNTIGNHIIYCDTIFEYKGQFCVNAQFWLPKTCAYILCYEY